MELLQPITQMGKLRPREAHHWPTPGREPRPQVSVRVRAEIGVPKDSEGGKQRQTVAGCFWDPCAHRLCHLPDGSKGDLGSCRLSTNNPTLQMGKLRPRGREWPANGRSQGVSKQSCLNPGQSPSFEVPPKDTTVISNDDGAFQGFWPRCETVGLFPPPKQAK